VTAKKCIRCDGYGEVGDPAHPTHFPMLCPKCGGTGKTPRTPKPSTLTYPHGIGQPRLVSHAEPPGRDAEET